MTHRLQAAGPVGIEYGPTFYREPLLNDLSPRPSGSPPAPSVHRNGAPVVLDGIAKRFVGPGGALEALAGVSLSVAAGEVFGIIGRSGAGKSTLIRCINRLETPTAGRVLIGGEEVTALADHALPALRRRIGMIFQHFNLLSAKTVFDNVALPLVIAGVDRATIARKVASVLDLVGLADKRDIYPAKLSGGQKQRVGIARALVHDPEVLLCDEATSSLDPETTLSILQLLKDINRRLGLTIVLITHEMAVVREICDRVVVIEAGRLVEQGEVWEVFARPQAEATRRLLAAVTPPLPPSLVDRLRPGPEGSSATVLDLRFVEEAAGTGVLADLARAAGVDFTLVHGTVEEIQSRRIGRLVLSIPNRSPEALAEAIAFLRGRAAAVEVLGYV